MTSAKRGPSVPTEAVAPAGHVAGRRALAGRSVLVGPESLVRDSRHGHVAGRRAPAGRRVPVGLESELPTRDPCRAQGSVRKVTPRGPGRVQAPGCHGRPAS